MVLDDNKVEKSWSYSMTFLRVDNHITLIYTIVLNDNTVYKLTCASLIFSVLRSIIGKNEVGNFTIPLYVIKTNWSLINRLPDIINDPND